MKFTIFAGDGGSMRMADKISFVADHEIQASAAVTYEVLVVDDGDDHLETDDVTEAAHLIAGLLYHYRDHSLVVHPCRAIGTRGNEEHTADIYPPGRQPRINVGD